MAKVKRVAPYKQRGRRSKKKSDSDESALKQAGIDTENLKMRMELMTAEQFANTQQIAQQNALTFFNEMLEEIKKRVPNMDDERLANTLLAIWDKIGGKK